MVESLESCRTIMEATNLVFETAFILASNCTSLGENISIR